MNEKTPWRKNLDKRYISGEDLLTGSEMKKGLQKEMIVTLASFQDAKAFDQKLQAETDKTAIWLKDYPSGKMVYKPMLLNVINGGFLAKEIGNGSMFIDDFDKTIPFVVYACPDKRHGHVVRCKQYIPLAKKPITPERFKAALEAIKAGNYTVELLKESCLLTEEQIEQL